MHAILRACRCLRESSPKLLRESLIAVLERYQKYEKYLQYPGEWGERAFRGWLVYEVFHIQLRWPISNIVFGEQFDVLLVDEAVKPVIYVETKKPERGLADLEAFKQRSDKYGTLLWVVLTDGYKWLRISRVNNKEKTFSLPEPNLSSWQNFFRVLKASDYIYEGD